MNKLIQIQPHYEKNTTGSQASLAPSSSYSTCNSNLQQPSQQSQSSQSVCMACNCQYTPTTTPSSSSNNNNNNNNIIGVSASVSRQPSSKII